MIFNNVCSRCKETEFHSSTESGGRREGLLQRESRWQPTTELQRVLGASPLSERRIMTQVKLSPPSFINLCANTDTRRNEQPNRDLVTFIVTQKYLISNIMQMLSFSTLLVQGATEDQKGGSRGESKGG